MTALETEVMVTWKIVRKVAMPLLEELGLTFDKIAYLNLMKFRTIDNHPPDTLYNRSWPQTVEQLNALSPALVVVLGAGAYRKFVKRYYGSANHDFVTRSIGEPPEFGVGLGRPLAQFGDVRFSSLGALSATSEHMRQKSLKTLRLQQALLDVLCGQIVEFFHRDGATRTAGLAVAGFGATGVVAVTAALAGAQRHRSTTSSAEADVGKERRATDDPWGDHRRTAALERIWTTSNSSFSTIAGTAISTISASALRSRVFQNLVLKRCRPM